MSAQLQHQAQHLAAPLPPLLIEAERIAQAVYQGVHGRRRAGVGETFWQFRRYEQGDPVERIDWRQSARTDKVFIREREYESAQSAYLWADMSGSMHYASQKNLPQKAERAQLLMLAAASLLLRGGEKVTWLDKNTTTTHGKNGLAHIVARLTTGLGASTPPEIRLGTHAHVVLCSDFLMPPEELQGLMHRYTALNTRGVLVHILDPVENNFALQGRVDLQGLEGEASLLLPNAAALREAYQEKLTAHKAHLLHLAQSASWHITEHVTDEKPHLALMQLYQFLAAEHP